MKGCDDMNSNNFRGYDMRRPNNVGYNMAGDRFIGGGFLGPFILGGITGGLLAPAFNQRPYYGPIYSPIPVYPTPFYQNQYQTIYYQ